MNITTNEYNKLQERRHIGVALDMLLELSYQVRYRMNEETEVFELIEQVTKELKEKITSRNCTRDNIRHT